MILFRGRGVRLIVVVMWRVLRDMKMDHVAVFVCHHGVNS
jgi:hypothetical protein